MAATRWDCGGVVSRHSPSERARRDVLYGLRDYESGDSEVVPEGPPLRPCSACTTPCRAIGINPLCKDCINPGRLK
jgi:hypothetical protein